MLKSKSFLLILAFSWANICFTQCPEILWQDEFESANLDTSKWSYEIGDGCDLNLCDWGNNELQWYQAENVEFSNGNMRIVAKKEDVNGKPYTSARIRSKGKGDWTYGRFEASIRLPAGQGFWPAFWMLPSGKSYAQWPTGGEIDIVELIGSETSEIHGTIHYGQPWPRNASSQASLDLNSGEFQDDFHTFAVEWEEGEIRWLIDDYLYSTKVPEDVSPEAWPFDQDFHLIFNLAVGGRWPGNPDETSVFPQAMEVEYVRVYDGFFPSISGKHQVDKNTENSEYSIHNAPKNATFQWSIPEGAKLVNGQGSSQIKVDWGETGGDIKVSVGNDCQKKEIVLNVKTLEPIVKKPVMKFSSIEDYETESRSISLISSAGKLDAGVINPEAEGINSSDKVGKYIRNKGDRYDVIVYEVKDFNPKDFIDGELKLYLDMYTTAPVGTEILVQLENSSLAKGSNYPIGRHSRFGGKTSRQNEWERMELSFQNQPDGSVDPKAVDRFIFLFAPNTETDDVFYFDNFDIYGPKSQQSSNK